MVGNGVGVVILIVGCVMGQSIRFNFPCVLGTFGVFGTSHPFSLAFMPGGRTNGSVPG